MTGDTEEGPVTLLPPQAERSAAPVKTKLPWGRILIVMTCFLADALSITVVLPMAPFMVRRMIHVEDADIGYYSGLVAASYTLGQLICFPHWGALSDRIGRRPVMIAGMCGNVIFMTAFGLAPTYATAVLFRFLQGLSSGNVIVARSYIADITDRSNEARAFAMIGAVFGFGGILGPMIGGTLTLPTENIAAFKGNHFLERFPFFLPCIVIVVITMIDLVFAIKYLGESKVFTKIDVDRKKALSPVKTPGQKPPPKPPSEFSIIFKNKTFVITCVAYGAYGFCWQAFNEGMAGLGSLIASVFVYPLAADYITLPNLFRIGLVLVMISFPWLAFITLAGWEKEHFVWWLVLCTTMVYQMGVEFAFTTANLMIKYSVPEYLIGTALGVGGTACTIGVTSGPLAGASLFAWSLSLTPRSGVWASGRAFFIVLEVLVTLNLVFTYQLPRWPWESVKEEAGDGELDRAEAGLHMEPGQGDVRPSEFGIGHGGDAEGGSDLDAAMAAAVHGIDATGGGYDVSEMDEPAYPPGTPPPPPLAMCASTGGTGESESRLHSKAGSRTSWAPGNGERGVRFPVPSSPSQHHGQLSPLVLLRHSYVSEDGDGGGGGGGSSPASSSRRSSGSRTPMRIRGAGTPDARGLPPRSPALSQGSHSVPNTPSTWSAVGGSDDGSASPGRLQTRVVSNSPFSSMRKRLAARRQHEHEHEHEHASGGAGAGKGVLSSLSPWRRAVGGRSSPVATATAASASATGADSSAGEMELTPVVASTTVASATTTTTTATAATSAAAAGATSTSSTSQATSDSNSPANRTLRFS